MKQLFQLLSGVRFFILLILLLLFMLIYQTLFNVSPAFFSSFWFVSLIGLLAINILLCLFCQTKTAGWYFILLHSGIGLILIGGALTMGFRFEAQLPLYLGKPTELVYTRNAVYRLPFRVELKNFSIDYYRPPYLKFVLNSKQSRRELNVRPGIKIELDNIFFRVKDVFNDWATYFSRITYLLSFLLKNRTLFL